MCVCVCVKGGEYMYAGTRERRPAGAAFCRADHLERRSEPANKVFPFQINFAEPSDGFYFTPPSGIRHFALCSAAGEDTRYTDSLRTNTGHKPDGR